MFFDPEKIVDKHEHHLPHWQQDQTWIFVTYRLADSLPEPIVARWKVERDHWISNNPVPHTEEQKSEYHKRFTLKLEDLLDDCHGSCVLRDEATRNIITTAFHFYDGERYELSSYVVMPNHIHILFRPLGNYKLADIIKNWKGFTSREIGKTFGKTNYALWQADYWDRLIRSQKHFDWVSNYIVKNPVKLAPKIFALWSRGHSCPHSLE